MKKINLAKKLVLSWVVLNLFIFILLLIQTNLAYADPHYVFVTDATYSSDLREEDAIAPRGLEGLAGAHAKCRQQAEDADLPGLDEGYNWKAWISIARDYEARDFIKHYDSAYVCPDEDETVVADDWDDLIDGELSHYINCTQHGDFIGNQRPLPWVYTNTVEDSSVYDADMDCNDFTYSHDHPPGAAEVNKGYAVPIINNHGPGAPGIHPDDWTDYFMGTCNSRATDLSKLYCFQQEFDGDTDPMDCAIDNEENVWAHITCGIDGGCNTFDGDAPYCCGDDGHEAIITEGIGDPVCCDASLYSCVVGGECMSGLEGLDYDGTCEDEIDNDCDGEADENDEDCVPDLTILYNNPCIYGFPCLCEESSFPKASRNLLTNPGFEMT